jgi:hypothetical protein
MGLIMALEMITIILGHVATPWAVLIVQMVLLTIHLNHLPRVVPMAVLLGQHIMLYIVVVDGFVWGV